MSAKNPAILDIPADTWTQVASEVRSGVVHILLANSAYYHTHRISVKYTVADETEQLALPDVRAGEIAYRIDEDKKYIALNDDNVSMSDWDEALDPDDAVVPGDADFEGVAVYYRIERINDEPIIIGSIAVRSTVSRDIFIYSKGADGRIRIDEGD